MDELRAICARCGAEKDLPLGRCAACGDAPRDEAREVALVCSARVLDQESLRAAQARIRSGEPVRPTAALLAKARALLYESAPQNTCLTGRQIAALVVGNLLLTPLLGYATWWRYRGDAGPAARQTLLATVPVSVLLLILLIAGRWTLNSALTVGG